MQQPLQCQIPMLKNISACILVTFLSSTLTAWVKQHPSINQNHYKIRLNKIAITIKLKNTYHCMGTETWNMLTRQLYLHQRVLLQLFSSIGTIPCLQQSINDNYCSTSLQVSHDGCKQLNQGQLTLGYKAAAHITVDFQCWTL